MRTFLIALLIGLLPTQALADQVDIDMAQCELEAWKVTGNKPNPVSPNGNMGFWKPAFDYAALCMKAKGYEGPHSTVLTEAWCDYFAWVVCWKKPEPELVIPGVP